MAANTVQANSLARAAGIVGEQSLHQILGVSADQLRRWVDGDDAIPPDVFLLAVDIVIDHEVRALAKARAAELPTAKPETNNSGATA